MVPLTRAPSILPLVPAVTLMGVPSSISPTSEKLPGRSGAVAVRNITFVFPEMSPEPDTGGACTARQLVSALAVPGAQVVSWSMPRAALTVPTGTPAPVAGVMLPSSTPALAANSRQPAPRQRPVLAGAIGGGDQQCLPSGHRSGAEQCGVDAELARAVVDRADGLPQGLEVAAAVVCHVDRHGHRPANTVVSMRARQVELRACRQASGRAVCHDLQVKSHRAAREGCAYGGGAHGRASGPHQVGLGDGNGPAGRHARCVLLLECEDRAGCG